MDRVGPSHKSHSFAIVPYQSHENKMDKVAKRFFALQRAQRRLLWKPATVTVLIGTSTAGKTSIISRMQPSVAGMVELGGDLKIDQLLHDHIQSTYPEEYEFLCSILKPPYKRQILDAFSDNIFKFQDDASLSAQEKAREMVSRLKGPFKSFYDTLNYIPLDMMVMEEALVHAAEGRPVILDALEIEAVTSRLLGKVPLQIALVYCPIGVLAERVFERNQRAIEEDNPSNIRLGPFPLDQMAWLFAPQTSPDEIPLFTITRRELEESFTLLYNQFRDAAPEFRGKRVASEAERVRLWEYLSSRLGFSDPSTQMVAMVPKFKGYDSVIDNTSAKPWESVRLLTRKDLRSLQGARFAEMLLPLTGRYLVAHTSQVIEEVPRINPLTLSPIRGRLGVEIYFPTTSDAGPQLPLVVAGKPTGATTHSHHVDTKAIVTARTYPLLVFSHASGYDPAEYRPLLEELTSHGIICLGLNHPYSSASSLVDSSIDGDLTFDQKELLQKEDMKYLLVLLRAGAINPKLHEMGDLSHIFVAGHSLGGAASVDVARDVPTLQGCINLDGALRGDHPQAGLSIPVLTLLSGNNLERRRENPQTLAMGRDWEAFTTHSEALNPHSRTVVIEGVDHDDFSSFPLLAKLEDEKVDIIPAHMAHQKATAEILRFIRRL